MAKPTLRRIDSSAFQEGLVSSLWQAWCYFCRQAVLDSVLGTTTSSGVPTTATYSGCNEAQLGFIAKKLAKSHNFNTIGSLSGLYLEPTWGDPQVFHRICVGMGLSNSNTLSSSVALALSLKDLQLCRNACSHLNRETWNQVIVGKVRYKNTELRHPSDMLLWETIAGPPYLWKFWLEEIEIISALGIE